MVSEEVLFAIISGSCLFISELLPFISKTETNGLLHGILLLIVKRGGATRHTDKV